MERKWECIGFEFPHRDEEYPDSVVKVIMDMKASPVRISKVEADIISAAPDLLEACESVSDYLKYSEECQDEMIIEARNILYTAIAKAKGEVARPHYVCGRK